MVEVPAGADTADGARGDVLVIRVVAREGVGGADEQSDAQRFEEPAFAPDRIGRSARPLPGRMVPKIADQRRKESAAGRGGRRRPQRLAALRTNVRGGARWKGRQRGLGFCGSGSSGAGPWPQTAAGSPSATARTIHAVARRWPNGMARGQTAVRGE